VKLLLSRGAIASLYTNEGKMPLQFSVELGSRECVALLLEHIKLDEIGYLRSLVAIAQKKKSQNVGVTNLLLAKIAELTLLLSKSDAQVQDVS
jgi:hypothetical protein